MDENKTIDQELLLVLSLMFVMDSSLFTAVYSSVCAE